MYQRAPLMIHAGGLKSQKSVSQQQLTDQWGANRRFYLSMARKELTPCKVCLAEGDVKVKKPIFNRSMYKIRTELHVCPECEGSGYEGIRNP